MSDTIIRNGFEIEVGDYYKPLCDGMGSAVDIVLCGLGMTGYEWCSVQVSGTSIVCNVYLDAVVRFDFERVRDYVCSESGLRTGDWEIRWKPALRGVVEFIMEHLIFDELYATYLGVEQRRVEVRPDYFPAEEDGCEMSYIDEISMRILARGRFLYELWQEELNGDVRTGDWYESAIERLVSRGMTLDEAVESVVGTIVDIIKNEVMLDLVSGICDGGYVGEMDNVWYLITEKDIEDVFTGAVTMNELVARTVAELNEKVEEA